MNLSDLALGDVISFTTYGSNTIPDVDNGTLVGFVLGTFLRNASAAATNHANIYASIPLENNVPNNYTKYNYLEIRLSDNTTVEIGMPWINELTLTRASRGVIRITVTDFNTEDRDALITLLNEHKDIIPAFTLAQLS